jgi:hypothetical protein
VLLDQPAGQHDPPPELEEEPTPELDDDELPPELVEPPELDELPPGPEELPPELDEPAPELDESAEASSCPICSWAPLQPAVVERATPTTVSADVESEMKVRVMAVSSGGRAATSSQRTCHRLSSLRECRKRSASVTKSPKVESE